ncbi:MAG TPA: hypothetical protein VFM71_09915 [Gemmatimonadaceae bacterium]|nr:hypothetical protein [Gemmatimonadaceae bacterium]
MLRTIFMIGLLAFAGLFVLKLFFGILGGLFGLLFTLLAMAIPIAIFGAVIYVLLRIFAPETARNLRGKFGGEA